MESRGDQKQRRKASAGGISAILDDERDGEESAELLDDDFGVCSGRELGTKSVGFELHPRAELHSLKEGV